MWRPPGRAPHSPDPRRLDPVRIGTGNGDHIGGVDGCGNHYDLHLVGAGC